MAKWINKRKKPKKRKINKKKVEIEGGFFLNSKTMDKKNFFSSSLLFPIQKKIIEK